MTLHPTVSPAVQLRTIASLYGVVRQSVASGTTPVVEVDLDLCAIIPRFRTTRAIAAVSREFSIEDWSHPESLPWLPGYSDEAWMQFLTCLDVPRQHPQYSWICEGRPDRSPGTPFARFHDLFWDIAGMSEDEPTPGLGSFVDQVESTGGRVVFLSGRWLPDHVVPSRECLRRAGIPNPQLVIGNPWHETLLPSGAPPLSDAELKAWRQTEIVSVIGQPIAIIDDRPSNRAAVACALSSPILSVAAAIPGFTCDPANIASPLRLSTFEEFSRTIHSRPRRPHMVSKHPSVGHGWEWTGEYAGLGKNGLPYLLPRHHPKPPKFLAGRAPFEAWATPSGQPSASEEALLDCWSQTIPSAELNAIEQALADAKRLALMEMAAPWPNLEDTEALLRRSMVCAWLHSRDIEVLMTAIGYQLPATGSHDLREFVDAAEIRRLVIPNWPPEQERVARARYSPWLVRWVASLGEGPVNVGFLNPSLLVDLCLWAPKRIGPEDAMDVHRLSDHHDGDRGERFDPLEAAINNLLHQREGRHGVRKEPVEHWADLARTVSSETGSVSLAKNSAARLALRDAIELGPELERSGWLTPWDLVT